MSNENSTAPLGRRANKCEMDKKNDRNLISGTRNSVNILIHRGQNQDDRRVVREDVTGGCSLVGYWILGSPICMPETRGIESSEGVCWMAVLYC